MLEEIRRALEEDIGSGDITTEATVDADLDATGRFIARQPLILAGSELLPQIFERVELFHHDGDRLEHGAVIAVVHGKARELLTRERVSLNFLQRLSGVATMARRYADAVAGTGCKILDTRKTTPGLRQLEKKAAAAGGVLNHRMGLYDGVLIKNNHITAAGGVKQALERVRAFGIPAGMRMEIEVRTQAELEEALQNGADHLLLDNLTPQEAVEWVAFIAGRATIELSGGIQVEKLREYAASGADYISAGAITYSAVAVDINFRLSLGAAGA